MSHCGHSPVAQCCGSGVFVILYLYLNVVLVGKPGGKRALGRPRNSWEDNFKLDLQEVGCGGMDWIDAAQDRERRRALVNAVMNFRVA